MQPQPRPEAANMKRDDLTTADLDNGGALPPEAGVPKPKKPKKKRKKKRAALRVLAPSQQRPPVVRWRSL